MGQTKFIGYKIKNKIYQSTRSIIYSAQREDDKKQVVIKTLFEDYPSRHEIARFHYEFQIQNKVESEAIVEVYSLENRDNKPVIVMEQFGEDLTNLITKNKGIDLTFFLDLAIQISKAIGEIHQHFIIHKDIKPHNILIDKQTKKIKIIDFGIATELSHENQHQHSHGLKGSLAYISPEQTGRMNRSVDYRTDLYSLGVTFYELLSGRLPFESNLDTMGWIHCHIAKIPEPLHLLQPEIPQAVSDIVTKLMSKNAEDRYLGTYGLIQDLENCRQQWKKTGVIKSFELALNDISNRFEIPQKLYGREKEIDLLMDSFETISNGESQIFLVGGYSGIGKSALINEVHKPIVERHGYFIEGKFDQFQRNVPYSAITQAFSSLIKQLMTESPEQLGKWREKLLSTLGPNGQVLIDIIPELEQVIGEQPEVPHLGVEENQNRFNMVFQEFLKLFTQQEHPLVLFIDDLQWVDSATLNLIKLFVLGQDHQYFLFLGAYRDNEVDHHHPFCSNG